MFDRQPRVRAFTGPRAEERAEIVGRFFKAAAGDDAARAWCIERGVAPAALKASGENAAGVAGFLAPLDFDAAIISVRERVGAFRQGAEIRPSRSDAQVRPRRFGGVTANFVLESAAIPESSFELDAVGVALRKLAVLVRSSSELFEDSAPDLGEFLASEIGYALAAIEDDYGFNGDGTSTYLKIQGLGTKLAGLASGVAAASGHNTFAGLDSTDIANVIAGVMAAAIPGAAWYVSNVAYAQTLCRLAAVSGGLTATKRPDGTIDAAYLGFPVIFSGKLPNSTASLAGKPMFFFGNLAMSSLIVESRQQLRLDISRERAMDADQVLTRGVLRLDINNHAVGDASTRGPVAALFGTT